MPRPSRVLLVGATVALLAVASVLVSVSADSSCEQECKVWASGFNQMMEKANQCGMYDEVDRRNCNAWEDDQIDAVHKECRNCCGSFYLATHKCERPTVVPIWHRGAPSPASGSVLTSASKSVGDNPACFSCQQAMRSCHKECVSEQCDNFCKSHYNGCAKECGWADRPSPSPFRTTVDQLHLDGGAARPAASVAASSLVRLDPSRYCLMDRCAARADACEWACNANMPDRTLLWCLSNCKSDEDACIRACADDPESETVATIPSAAPVTTARTPVSSSPCSQVCQKNLDQCQRAAGSDVSVRANCKYWFNSCNSQCWKANLSASRTEKCAPACKLALFGCKHMCDNDECKANCDLVERKCELTCG